MPSDRAQNTPLKISGRCYCGAHLVRGDVAPQTVTYCHCSDCRRLSGAPVAAFAAFGDGDLTFTPPLGTPISHSPGVERWFCPSCGTQLAARYDYLPGQLYVPLGLLDQADELPPRSHAHAGDALPWLKIHDTLPRDGGSARARLQEAKEE